VSFDLVVVLVLGGSGLARFGSVPVAVEYGLPSVDQSARPPRSTIR